MFRKLLLAMTVAGTLCLNSTTMAMPNPMVSYPSVLSCEQTAGFSALTIPPGIEATLNDCFVISDRIIDLRYTDSKGREYCLRTAPFDHFYPDISGVYPSSWEDITIGSGHFSITTTDTNISAAYWYDQEYSYALSVQNMAPDEFREFAYKVYMSINPAIKN